ncbi:MAG: SLATT domain-containing protein [Parabacteroides sp.]|nr:SLATT domain-containing protein [Parabacteroides sp.]
MAQDSQVSILEGQIRECFGRVAWSHKTQEKCADIVSDRNSCIKTVQIILSALTTTGVIVTIAGDCKAVSIITAIISTLLVAINTFLKGTDLGEIAQKHSDAASKLWNIREKYLSLITDINIGGISIDEMTQRRDELQEDLFNIYLGSPRTINKAYKKATEALKLNEELTFSSDEIDMLLPIQLRKGTSK